MPGIDGPGVLSALPDLSPRWRRTVGPAQPCGVSPDVPHGSQRPPPNRAPTAGVWRQGVRPFRDLPTPEPHSGLCCVSPGDPATPGSLACRWRTAKPAGSRPGPSARSPPGPLYVTSDRDAPAARPGPSRHRPARGFTNNYSLTMHGEGKLVWETPGGSVPRWAGACGRGIAIRCDIERTRG